MIIPVLLGLFSLPPRMKLIMLLKDFPRLSRMREIVTFLPLSQIIGVSSRMRNLTNFVANSESSTIF